MRNVFLCVSLSSLSRSPFHPLNSYSAAWLTSWPREGKSSTSLGGSSVLQLGLHASFTSFLLSARAHNYPYKHTPRPSRLGQKQPNKHVSFLKHIFLSLSLGYRYIAILLFVFYTQPFVRGWIKVFLSDSVFTFVVVIIEIDEMYVCIYIYKRKWRVDRSISLSLRNSSVSSDSKARDEIEGERVNPSSGEVHWYSFRLTNASRVNRVIWSNENNCVNYLCNYLKMNIIFSEVKKWGRKLLKSV